MSHSFERKPGNLQFSPGSPLLFIFSIQKYRSDFPKNVIGVVRAHSDKLECIVRHVFLRLRNQIRDSSSNASYTLVKRNRPAL